MRSFQMVSKLRSKYAVDPDIVENRDTLERWSDKINNRMEGSVHVTTSHEALHERSVLPLSGESL